MRFLKIAVFVLVHVAVFAVASTAGAAGAGSVTIVPASSNVPQGSTVDIDVVIDPPDGGTSIWIIRVTYDPGIVQYVSCDPMDNPGGGIAFAAGCDNVTPDGVTFGGWVQNDNGTPRGFETPQRAGTFRFQAIGPPGLQSPLHVTVQAMLGPNGEQQSPQTFDGVINVLAGPSPTPAPVGGTVDVLAAPRAGEPVTWVVALAAVALVITGGVTTAAVSRRVRR